MSSDITKTLAARNQSGVTVPIRMAITASQQAADGLVEVDFDSFEVSIDSGVFSGFSPSSFSEIGDGYYRIGLAVDTPIDFERIEVRGNKANHSSKYGLIEWDGAWFRGIVTSIVGAGLGGTVTLADAKIGMTVEVIKGEEIGETRFISNVAGQVITFDAALPDLDGTSIVQIYGGYSKTYDALNNSATNIDETISSRSSFDQTTDEVLLSSATVNLIRDSLNDFIIEGTLTRVQAERVMLAALANISTNGGTVYRDLADTKDRIAATIDGSNNRTAVVLDGS